MRVRQSEKYPFEPLGPVQLYINADRPSSYFSQPETEMQWAFRDWLHEEQPHLAVEREVSLPSRRRPDFIAAHVIAGLRFVTVYELKLRASRAAVRQLAEYVEEVQQLSNALVSGVLAAEEFYLGEGSLPAWIALVRLRVNFYHDTTCQH